MTETCAVPGATGVAVVEAVVDVSSTDSTEELPPDQLKLPGDGPPAAEMGTGPPERKIAGGGLKLTNTFSASPVSSGSPPLAQPDLTMPTPGSLASAVPSGVIVPVPMETNWPRSWSKE